jgi:hypothetical protein
MAVAGTARSAALPETSFASLTALKMTAGGAAQAVGRGVRVSGDAARAATPLASQRRP